MKFIVSLAASAVLGAAVAAPSLQDSQDSGARPLTPVGGVEDAAEEAEAPVRPFLGGVGRGPSDAPAGGRDLEEGIRQRLTVSDLDLRMESFQEVAEQAAVSADVRRALGAIARDTADLDLAFSARLALREVERIGARGRAGSAFGSTSLTCCPVKARPSGPRRSTATSSTRPWAWRTEVTPPCSWGACTSPKVRSGRPSSSGAG